jgi:ubiquinone/menaquinone biosynthesis C-methylase UbiE
MTWLRIGDMITGGWKDPGYVLGHSDRELERLSVQAKLFDPLTQQLFRDAGIAPGMRVLDVGSGSGDVSFLVGRMVGPSGEVIGTDKSPAAVDTAKSRAAALQLPNVRFFEGDPTEMPFEQPFDAVVGRLVLMYVHNPAESLRKLAKHLRAGGVIAFHEFDFSGSTSQPKAPIYDQCIEWINKAFQLAGIEMHMGLKLYSAYKAAGLPAPSLRLDASVGGGPDYLAYLVVAEVVRSLLPVMEKFSLATAAEVGIETLADRIRDEVVAGGGVVVTPPLVGAWSRKPE